MEVKNLFEEDHGHIILLRCHDNDDVIYQGEPDLETLSSYIFHYGDKKHDIFVCLDVNNKRVYTNDIVSFKLLNVEYIALVVYDREFRRFGLEFINYKSPILPLGDIKIKLIRSIYNIKDER